MGGERCRAAGGLCCPSCRQAWVHREQVLHCLSPCLSPLQCQAVGLVPQARSIPGSAVPQAEQSWRPLWSAGLLPTAVPHLPKPRPGVWWGVFGGSWGHGGAGPGLDLAWGGGGSVLSCSVPLLQGFQRLLCALHTHSSPHCLRKDEGPADSRAEPLPCIHPHPLRADYALHSPISS